MNRFLLKGLKKYFKRGGFFSRGNLHLVLDIGNMEIKKGVSVGLIGESGSGKTTIARLMMRIIRPDEGVVEYLGKDLFSLKGEELKEYRRRCQMIFQDPSSQFNPRMNVYEILKEPLIINGITDGAEEKIDEVINLVSLPEEIKKRYVHQISGGQRQRISIARALILNPEFIICDEPVSALDISVQSQILNLLYRLRDKIGVNYLLISHDLMVVRFLCDYVYILLGGRIVECGTIDEIFNEPLHPYTKELIEAAELKIDDTNTLKEYDLSSPDRLCPYTRCERYSECDKEVVVEHRISDTHRVFCNRI